MDELEMFTVPQGTFDLRRRHDAEGSPLRAWDAADAYVLDHLADPLQLPDGLEGRSIVIVNDAHGALTVALADHRPTSISDSFVSRQATIDNLDRNGRAPDSVRFASTLEPVRGSSDLVVVKIPKTLALLEHQLRALAHTLAPDAHVIGAGMTRHIHSSTLTTFELAIGPTKTSLARRKARLIHATPTRTPRSPDPWGDSGPDPAGWRRFALSAGGPTIVSGPGVFAEGRFDIGTRLLVDHLATRPASGTERDVIDLGCGNGVVGLTFLLANPAARVSFVDESTIAVRSAQETVAANSTPDDVLAERCQFLLGDVLDRVVPVDEASGDLSPVAQGVSSGEPRSADLVLINPPFHDDHTVGDAVAWRMFTAARRVLRPGGEVLVVGNRHLGYHAKLRRLFGDATIVRSNPKFVVVSATR